MQNENLLKWRTFRYIWVQLCNNGVLFWWLDFSINCIVIFILHMLQWYSKLITKLSTISLDASEKERLLELRYAWMPEGIKNDMNDGAKFSIILKFYSALYNRAFSLCSSEHREDEIKLIDEQLRLNNYPKRFYDSIKRKSEEQYSGALFIKEI